MQTHVPAGQNCHLWPKWGDRSPPGWAPLQSSSGTRPKKRILKWLFTVLVLDKTIMILLFVRVINLGHCQYDILGFSKSHPVKTFLHDAQWGLLTQIVGFEGDIDMLVGFWVSSESFLVVAAKEVAIASPEKSIVKLNLKITVTFFMSLVFVLITC